jgi:CheY-like chemotaxis protein
MAYATVTKAHGFIEVDSAPGEGTTFRLGLPAVAATAGEADEPEEAPRPTVLLVEDEPALRELAAAILGELGYHLLEAGDGQEAMAIAEAHPGRIHLLVTDVVMPLVSGPELVRHLRRLRPETPVLYMSGYTDSRLVNRGLEHGRAEVIQKPFDPDELGRRAAELLLAAEAEGPEPPG